MKRIKINFSDDESVKLMVNSFQKGEVLIYPTDTVYGLGCVADNPEAIKRIYRIKKREIRKPLLVLMDSLRMIKKYCKINDEQERYMEKEGFIPTTFILKGRQKLPVILSGVDGKIAVRIPQNDFLQKIISHLDMPITSTSVNISGQEIVHNLDNIENAFSDTEPDIIFEEENFISQNASRIIDITDMRNIMIVRD